MNPRQRVGRLARCQHGLITRAQALALGLTPGQIRDCVRRGEWLSVRPGVYALVGAPATWHQAIAAVTFAADPAWASHLTAGELWAFRNVRGDAIDLVTPLDRHLRLTGVRAHRSGALFTADLTRHHGIPVMTPERTLTELSGSMAAVPLGRILDDGIRRRIIRLDRLRRCVGRLEGSPGRRPAVLHELLADRLPGFDPGDSDFETRVLRLLVAAGMPPPVQQYRLRLNGRSICIDLSYPDLKLAIELDGWEVHGTRSAFDDDRARANAIVLHGWRLLRFTSRSTDHEIVASVMAARAALAA